MIEASISTELGKIRGLKLTVVGKADSVIFCDTCRRVVGIDMGRPVDVPIITTSINLHQQLSNRIFHQIDRIVAQTRETVEYRANEKQVIKQ